jgi:hypothetical protein
MAIESIEYIDVTEWKPRSQPMVATNPLGIYNCAGYPVYLVWNDPQCRWDVLQPTYHKIGRPVMSIDCASSGCGIDQVITAGDIVVQQCDNCGEQYERVPAIVGEMQDYVKELNMSCGDGCTPSIQYGKMCVMCADGSIAKSDKDLPTVDGYMLTNFGKIAPDEDEDGIPERCGLSATKARICFIGCSETIDADYVDFTQIKPATDIVFDCTTCPTLDWDKTAMWVLCVGGAETGGSGECECTDCEQSSPSSTPSATGA